MAEVVWMRWPRGTPGSPEARKQGCVCPVIDNHHGKGRPKADGGRSWIQVADCPVHVDEEGIRHG